MHELESLSVVLALEKSETAKEVIAAAAAEFAVVVAVEDGVLEPCNVEPIPAKHSEDFHHPFLQIPLGSYKAEFPHSTMFSAYPVRFFSVRVEVIPA